MSGVDERLRRSTAHVVVDSLEGPMLDDDIRHHLARVLRLRPGSELSATDGEGRWRWMRWTGGSELEPVDDTVNTVTRPLPPLAVAFAPTKGDRPEWVVQKLTELGIDRIVPIVTHRSVVRWDAERADRQVQRWRRIAREALAQCRGVFLPRVERVTDVGTLAATEHVRMAEPGGDPPMADGVMVAVGPEGGFTATELEQAVGTVGLPGGVLRSETAALAVGVLLAAARERTAPT